jgi:hypothetical protein
MDSTGKPFIAEGLNLRVRRVDVSGIISTFAGTGPEFTAGAVDRRPRHRSAHLMSSAEQQCSPPPRWRKREYSNHRSAGHCHNVRKLGNTWLRSRRRLRRPRPSRGLSASQCTALSITTPNVQGHKLSYLDRNALLSRVDMHEGESGGMLVVNEVGTVVSLSKTNLNFRNQPVGKNRKNGEPS